MNKPKKMTIRITFPSQHNASEQKNNSFSYDWGRIIGVLFASIFITTAIIGGILYYFNQNDSVDENIKLTTLIAAHVSSDEVAEQLAFKKANDESVRALQVIQKNSTQPAFKKANDESAHALQAIQKNSTQPAFKKANNESAHALQAIQKNSTQPTIKQILTSNADAPASEANNENKNVLRTPQKAPLPASTIVTDTIPLFSASESEILSDHIERFVIASSVRDNEPAGTINNISFDSNNIATVYAYSDVRRLQASTIYYQWILNGKKIAKVRVDVGARRWRSYSSKFIKSNMHGNWEVQLHSEGGKKLANIKFMY